MPGLAILLDRGLLYPTLQKMLVKGWQPAAAFKRRYHCLKLRRTSVGMTIRQF